MVNVKCLELVNWTHTTSLFVYVLIFLLHQRNLSYLGAIDNGDDDKNEDEWL